MKNISLLCEHKIVASEQDHEEEEFL